MSLYKQISNTLKTVYDEGEAKAVTAMLLEHHSISLAKAMTEELPLNDKLADDINRLRNGEPIQYVTGYTDFCGLRIDVEQGVLIPRPETEELIKHFTHHISHFTPKSALHILDIGTGSGCIALALKKALPEAKVTGVDISEEALKIARNNANNLNLDVDFIQCDILSNQLSALSSQLSAIISNPPYICQSEKAEMEANVLNHEPHEALFVPDDDPLLFYRRIAELGRSLLVDDGTLWFEINRKYGEEVVDMLREKGYSNIELMQDQYGNDRFVKADK